ncbi:hypothetical protein [Nocardia sp. NPDC052316]|uniref:hypothetical protein n=1 Tax=Nocardia sp. NPDC052316 TaxID=3364329 RepID=UPI0037C6672E
MARALTAWRRPEPGAGTPEHSRLQRRSPRAGIEHRRGADSGAHSIRMCWGDWGSSGEARA